MNVTTHHAEDYASMIQIFHDPNTLDATARTLLEAGVPGSNIRVFANANAARELRNHPSLAALIVCAPAEQLRDALMEGEVAEAAAREMVNEVMNGDAMMVVRSKSPQVQQKIADYLGHQHTHEHEQQLADSPYCGQGCACMEEAERAQAERMSAEDMSAKDDSVESVEDAPTPAEESSSKPRVLAREKSTDRHNVQSSRYAQASRTAGIGNSAFPTKHI